MLYAIIATDVENSLEKRMSVRPAHLERLNALKDAGHLVLAAATLRSTATTPALPVSAAA